MVSIPVVIPESLFFGVAIALIFVIVVGLSQLQNWPSKLAHKKRKKIKQALH